MDIKEIKIMVKEEYVSFETAKLAKEKGFNEHCKYFYEECLDSSIDRWECTDGLFPVRVNEFFCPTQSLLARWLMDKRDIFLSPNISAYGYNFEIVKISTLRVLKVTVISRKYEEAFEIALQDALKLI